MFRKSQFGFVAPLVLMQVLDANANGTLHRIERAPADALLDLDAKTLDENMDAQADAIAETFVRKEVAAPKEKKYEGLSGVELHQDPETGEVYASIARIPLRQDPLPSDSGASVLYNVFTHKTGYNNKHGEEIVISGHIRAKSPKPEESTRKTIGI